jgi:hypothetical protein
MNEKSTAAAMTNQTTNQDSRSKVRRSRSSKSNIACSNKNIWTQEEDEQLLRQIAIHGPQSWTTISKYIEGREGKQCRERWRNHLSPHINKECWKADEEWMLFLLHKLIGNSWSILSKLTNSRTDNCIKNHWNSIMQKKLQTFEDKLSEIMSANNFTTIDNPMERNLLIKIQQGKPLVESARQGRKKNRDKNAEERLISELTEFDKRHTSIQSFDHLEAATSNQPTKKITKRTRKSVGRLKVTKSKETKNFESRVATQAKEENSGFNKIPNQTSMNNFSLFGESQRDVNDNFIVDAFKFSSGVFSYPEFEKAANSMSHSSKCDVNEIGMQKSKEREESYFCSNKFFINSMLSFYKLNDYV